MSPVPQVINTPALTQAAAAVRLGRVDCTNDQYHGGGGISKSHLDVVAKSPLHYWQAYRNPDREPRETTAAFATGTLVHAAILEPDVFLRDFILVPDHAPRKPTSVQRGAAKPSAETVQAIAWWDWFEADCQAKGRTVATPEDMKIALGCRDSVYRVPAIAKLLAKGRPEQSYYAIDPDTGVLVKCRADWDALEHGHILDVKSTVSASPDSFARSVIDYRYHVQQPFYHGVIEAALDAEIPKDWYFLAVEKTPPYACALYTLPADIVAAGRVSAASDLFTIVDCDKRDRWPGYYPEAVELQFPSWARRAIGADSAEVDFQ